MGDDLLVALTPHSPGVRDVVIGRGKNRIT